MLNFDFISPTRFIFGKGQEQKVGEICKEYDAKKVMVLYGAGPFTALVDEVVSSIETAGLICYKFGEVEPNPRMELAMEAIELCKKENVDFIVAVGGGSTIDSAKCVGVGALYDGDVRDFYPSVNKVERTLPVGCVLTNAAAGSEGSRNSLMRVAVSYTHLDVYKRQM